MIFFYLIGGGLTLYLVACLTAQQLVEAACWAAALLAVPAGVTGTIWVIGKLND